MKFLRIDGVIELRGKGRSSNYTDVQAGLLTRPVKIGLRAVAWPEHEVLAINAARAAGKSDDEIRMLVTRLIADRKQPA